MLENGKNALSIGLIVVIIGGFVGAIVVSLFRIYKTEGFRTAAGTALGVAWFIGGLLWLYSHEEYGSWPIVVWVIGLVGFPILSLARARRKR